MKRNLQSRVALIGTGLLASAAPAFAQPAERVPSEAGVANTGSTDTGAPNTTASESDGIGDVIVTARRREESLQKVPIAVTVFSGEELNEKGISNGIDLARNVPSLVIRPINVSTKVLRVGLRGIINNSTLLTDDPSVGLYFAEVPIAHPFGLGSNFYDLENVQVLKGPQGTLFGRNSTGGAILVSPKVATVGDRPEGYIRLTYGTYDARVVEAAINLPIGSKVAVRVAGVVRERDGYTTNILTGQKYDDENKRAFRASVTLAPTEDITSTTLFDYLKEDEAPNSGLLNIVHPGVTFGGAGTFDRLIAEQKARGPRKFATWSGTNGPMDLFSPARCASGVAVECREHVLPRQVLKNYGVLNNTAVDIGDVTLKNIVSYRKSNWLQDSIDVIPGGSKFVGTLGFQSMNDSIVKQFTEEFQVAGSTFSSRLNFATGIFYIKEWGNESGGKFYFGAPFLTNNPGTFDQRSLGVYAQGTYAIMDNLKVTAGARFNRDKRQATTSTTGNNGTICTIENDQGTGFLPLSECFLSDSKSWTATTWTASIEYNPNSRSMVYLTARRGYKSGGFGLRTRRASLFSYDPEYVTDIEGGIKADWDLLGSPTRTSLAIYQSNYTDQQVTVNDYSRPPVLSYVSNVGKSRIRGFEVETTFRPTPNLTISGFVSYTDPKFLKYIDPGSGADFSYRPFGIPKWLGGLSADYRLPLANDKGVLGARVDAQFLSKNIVDNSKPVPVPGDPTSGFIQNVQPAYTVVNGRIEWELPSNSVTIAAFVTNLFDKLYTNGGGTIVGIQTSNYAPPRMFGAELTYRFGK